MRWILLGAVFGLLLVFPNLLAIVITVVAAVLPKPIVVAFGLGLAARPHLPRLRRWTA
ncbi:hypothetical protein ABZ890_08260 [Streptomyces sp. NPDC046984]|uniref:hypothetical protein n=1 Tax=Streptomyces sp. NPDC046984 TaxID=3155138 RepID=UPI0033DEF974